MRNEMNSSLHFTLGILAMKNEMNSSLHFTLGILAMKNEMISGLHFYFVFWRWKRGIILVCISFYLWGDFSLDEDCVLL
jgi:hypothetical protein